MENIEHKIPTLNFNPFGGLNDREILEVIVPKYDFDVLINLLDTEEQIILELVGKKGRGKTLYLRCLYLLLGKYPIFYLDSNSSLKKLLESDAELILVDSIHHLNFFDRIKLFKKKKKIILTTHIRRSLEYRIAGKFFQSRSFKGINRVELKNIIENRITNAGGNSMAEPGITMEKIDDLIRLYGDDFRAIMSHLFDEYKFKE